MTVTNVVKYKIEVYDITAASGYVSGLAEGVTATDDNCVELFDTSKYASLPSGTQPLTAVNLETKFNRKRYTDVNTAKTAIISDTLASAITAQTHKVEYALSNGDLTITAYFDASSKATTLATAINADGWSKERGAVLSTIS
tara:strand:+ start:2849 stop:3274 length:426 start_codon:yes stop_codon:yes gene_type:complete